MTSNERIQATLDFRPVDYVGLFDQYWGNFIAAWRKLHGLPPADGLMLNDTIEDEPVLRSHYHIDAFKLGVQDAPWPSKAEVLSRDEHHIVLRDSWGRIVRRTPSSVYGEPLKLPIREKRDLDAIPWESPVLETRFAPLAGQIQRVRETMEDPYIFIKVGGPFLRSSFLRGEVQWYVDLLEDPEFACAVADRVADHICSVGVEGLKRSGLKNTSVWIYDDVAGNTGPLIPPAVYEAVILPRIRRMATAFRAAGAAHVGLHSDGDIRPLLDGLVDAGISVINPVEPRAGMDVVKLRERYGKRLAFVGGFCNSQILPFGTKAEIRRHIEHVLSIHSDGGLVAGSHTVSGEISIDHYDYVMKVLHAFGRPLPGNGRAKT